MRPLRKIGVSITMSGRWPVPITGSFVASTSPSSSVSGGKAGRKWFCAAIGSEVMNTGIDHVHCDKARPLASSTTVT
jgi:hypothetical protein